MRQGRKVGNETYASRDGISTPVSQGVMDTTIASAKEPGRSLEESACSGKVELKHAQREGITERLDRQVCRGRQVLSRRGSEQLVWCGSASSRLTSTTSFPLSKCLYYLPDCLRWNANRQRGLSPYSYVSLLVYSNEEETTDPHKSSPSDHSSTCTRQPPPSHRVKRI